MEDHADALAVALSGGGPPIEAIFYCAESVLLPECRWQGVGHRFFDLREAHARAIDAFWRASGYAPLEGAVARFALRDLGEAGESEKPLQFWIRRLGGNSHGKDTP